MRKIKTYNIEGKEYIATQTVVFNSKLYQEFASCDVLNPEFLYAESKVGRFKVVRDWKTFSAMRRLQRNIARGNCSI